MKVTMTLTHIITDICSSLHETKLWCSCECRRKHYKLTICEDDVLQVFNHPKHLLRTLTEAVLSLGTFLH